MIKSAATIWGTALHLKELAILPNEASSLVMLMKIQSPIMLCHWKLISERQHYVLILVQGLAAPKTLRSGALSYLSNKNALQRRAARL